MLADFHNPVPDTAEYTVGQSVEVKVQIPPSGGGEEGTDTPSYVPADYPHKGATLFTLRQTDGDRRAQTARLQKEAEDSDLQLHRRLSGGTIDSADVVKLRQRFIERLRV